MYQLKASRFFVENEPKLKCLQNCKLLHKKADEHLQLQTWTALQ